MLLGEKIIQYCSLTANLGYVFIGLRTLEKVWKGRYYESRLTCDDCSLGLFPELFHTSLALKQAAFDRTTTIFIRYST